MSAAPSKKTLTGSNGDDNVQNIMVCWVMKYSLLCPLQLPLHNHDNHERT